MPESLWWPGDYPQSSEYMQIDSRWLETANALIIALIASTAFPSRTIYRYRPRRWCENRCTVHSRTCILPAIIIIVSLGVRECLIPPEHVLAWDKLVNHLIMGSFLIPKRKPRSILHECIMGRAHLFANFTIQAHAQGSTILVYDIINSFINFRTINAMPWY